MITTLGHVAYVVQAVVYAGIIAELVRYELTRKRRER